MQIDRRKRYFLIFDTETCNSSNSHGEVDPTSALVYDFGFVIADKHGNIYEKGSYIVSDVFIGMRDLMYSAYYANKIPLYTKAITSGQQHICSYFELKKIVAEVMAKYNCNTVVAHNCYFDYCATNATQRYLTKSKYRYFFPFGTVYYDSLKMARDTICKQKSYRKFCEKNNYLTAHKTPQPRASAEILYRYITQNTSFNEEHTGLEDALIGTKIFAHCYRQHKKMRKTLFVEK